MKSGKNRKAELNFMAKQSAIEQDGSINSYQMRCSVELENGYCNRTYLEKCVCIISLPGDKVKLEMSPSIKSNYL
jgi:hypothetical protein